MTSPTAGATTGPTTVPIGEVVRRTGLSVHTVRFYEARGLLISPPQRDARGNRVYDEDDITWLTNCCLFRASGMPLAVIARFAELVREGSGNEAERLRLLHDHRRQIAEQTAALAAAERLIESKIDSYTRHLGDGTAATLWTSG